MPSPWEFWMPLILAATGPFLAESFVKSGTDDPTPRSDLFYVLSPLLGMLVFATFLSITGYISMAALLIVVTYGGLTVISNLKVKVLRDPFIAHDFENARHLFLHPEFYINHIGLGRVIGIFALIGIVAGFCIALDTPIAARQTLLPPIIAYGLGLAGWLPVLAILSRAGKALIHEGKARVLGIDRHPRRDVARFGLFPAMLLYGLLLMDRRGKTPTPWNRASGPAPCEPTSDIVVIQSESYFDIARFYRQLEKNAAFRWKTLDALTENGTQVGRLDVPAWGAYTMQTEMSFLTGIDIAALGIDWINPYLKYAHQPVWSIAHALKEAGYRTICIHPAHKGFFRRDSVMPHLGFDAFLGIEAFPGAERFGPYVSDRALGDKIDTLLSEGAGCGQPSFIFAISIESHGPWEAGRFHGLMNEDDLVAGDPTGNLAFALYRQHLENALALFGRLQHVPNGLPDRVIAMYGDHQPALGDVFSAAGFDDSDVDYLLWHSARQLAPAGDLAVRDLGRLVLKAAGFDIEGIPHIKTA